MRSRSLIATSRYRKALLPVRLSLRCFWIDIVKDHLVLTAYPNFIYKVFKAGRFKSTVFTNDASCCERGANVTKVAVETAINQGIHRFLADGVHYRDLMDIRAAAPDWESLPQTWMKWGAETEKRAEAALAANATLTAATEFSRASLYYHY